MSWMIIAAVFLATAGLLVLGWLAIAVHREVLALSRELDAAARRVSGAARNLEGTARMTAVRTAVFIQDGSEPA